MSASKLTVPSSNFLVIMHFAMLFLPNSRTPTSKSLPIWCIMALPSTLFSLPASMKVLPTLTRLQNLHWRTLTYFGIFRLSFSAMQNSQNSPTKRQSSLDLLQVGQYLGILFSYLWFSQYK